MKYNKQKLLKEHKKLSYRQLAKKYGVSCTYLWQVCTDYDKKNTYYCKIHHRKYWKECILCEVDRQYEGLLSEEDIIKEVKKIRNTGAGMEAIWRKKILVTRLRDGCMWTFVKIGKLFNMNYSSIIYLYYKYKTQIK